MSVRRLIKKIGFLFGVEVRLIQNVERVRSLEELAKWRKQWAFLADYGICTILDVGANEGQFAEMIRGVFPEAKIISFEPLPSCFNKLETVIRKIGHAEYLPVGIGEESSTCTMYESSSTPSSSMLVMNDLHKKEWPSSSKNEAIEIQIKTLDDALATFDLVDGIAIKIDVQGFEDKVLRGGVQTFERAKVVVIETSFSPLYEGQPLFQDIYVAMEGLGFSYQGALDTSHSTLDGHILQEDSLFVKLDCHLGSS